MYNWIEKTVNPLLECQFCKLALHWPLLGQIPEAMIKNYFITGLRNLLRNKGYAFINIAGLSIGIAFALVIYLIVTYELSYNGMVKDLDQLYRVVNIENQTGSLEYNGGSPYPLRESLREYYGNDVDAVAQIYVTSDMQVAVTDTDGKATDRFRERESMAYVEPQFVEMMGFEHLQGPGAEVLAQPDRALISATLAKKYFGTADPVGQILRLNNEINVTIEGVFQSYPQNSDLNFHLFISFVTLEKVDEGYKNNHWGSVSSNVQTFVKLKPGQDKGIVESRFDVFQEKYEPERYRKNREYIMQPIASMHTDERFYAIQSSVMPVKVLYAIATIGFFLLLTACINFINLATAQSLGRSKEVGIRKTMGGQRSQVFWQMMTEILIIVLFSALLALGVTEVIIYYIKHYLSVNPDLNLRLDLDVLVFLLFSIAFVWVLAGVYPAGVMSGFSPVAAMKNLKTSHSKRQLYLRKGLVVLQFAITQFLIIGTFTIYSQTEYFLSKDLGFRQKAVLFFNVQREDANRRDLLAAELSRFSEVEGVTFSAGSPTASSNWKTNFFYKEGENENESHAWVKFIDENYLELFDLNLLAGNNLLPSDSSNEMVVNMQLLDEIGIASPEEAIGVPIRIGSEYHPITGVVSNFHNQDLGSRLEPLVFVYDKTLFFEAAVMLNTSDLSGSVDKIQRSWEAIYPEFVFESFFLDQEIANNYRQEQTISRLLQLFSVIAILIGCMGLYGLVSYMAAQRIKEIGVRKVLGASIAQILMLFSKQFFTLLLLAFLVAGPLAWLVMNNWLNQYAYHIHLSPFIFLGALLLAMLIAGITVSLKSYRAATTNPSRALRDE